jgi:hypothetical protein
VVLFVTCVAANVSKLFAVLGTINQGLQDSFVTVRESFAVPLLTYRFMQFFSCLVLYLQVQKSCIRLLLLLCQSWLPIGQGAHKPAVG